MEKQVKQRNKVLPFLPKAASAVTFQVSTPISPAGKGYSGPIVSLIPKEARRKSKNGSFDEPTSPKVSCMGQIKCRKKKETVTPPQVATEEMKRKRFLMLKVLKGTKGGHRFYVSNAGADQVAERVPSSLRQMKQFSSARGTLTDFDWMAYEAEGAGEAGCVSNPLYEEKGVKSEKEAKVVVNGVGVVEEIRRENLWTRRTTASLTPIQL
ncbi:PREDICTED: uncharacterized protein At1g76070 [Theobroma cacao]|uniref:Uncharacterized protein At1g76070 n=1 Tax=Theobroma cacao TaxID=3641 RepID=A0AB32WUI7_THECC|nr:PREDICTED: uncharacterized protein At1g76070 [Theobroma cacao]